MERKRIVSVETGNANIPNTILKPKKMTLEQKFTKLLIAVKSLKANLRLALAGNAAAFYRVQLYLQRALHLCRECNNELFVSRVRSNGFAKINSAL